MFIKSLFNVLYHPLNKSQKVFIFFRILFWKLNQLFFKYPVVIQFTKSIKCICYPQSSYGSMIIYEHFPDYFEAQFLLKILKKDSNFVDVGAGLGDYSLLAAEKIKTGHIYAFEPVSLPCSQFKENIAINNLQNIITLSTEVVSNSNKGVHFDEEDITEVSHISAQAKGKKHPSISLDSLVKQKNIKKIYILKVDVEGAEMLVLSGGKKIFKKGIVKNIILELNANNIHFGTSHTKVIEFLQKQGYSLRVISNDTLIDISDITQTETKNILCVHSSTIKNLSIADTII